MFLGIIAQFFFRIKKRIILKISSTVSQFLIKGARTPPTQFFVDGWCTIATICILTGASPLQHKDKVPAEGAAH